MGDALAQTLDQLQGRLLQARAQLRRAKKNAETKRAVLLDSQAVLGCELKDAFSMDALPKRKRPRFEPPPGLTALLPGSAPSPPTTDEHHQPEDMCHPCILSCTVWAHEDRDHVWVRATIENPLPSTIYRVHLMLSTGTRSLLPQTIHRNTVLSVAGGKTAVLYASFTMLDDVFLHQITTCLSASCQYASESGELHASDALQPSWETTGATTWMKPGMERALPAIFPARATMSVSQNGAGFEDIKRALDLRYNEEATLFYTQDQHVVIQCGDCSTTIHVYSVSDRSLARAIDKLRRRDAVTNVSYAPPQPVEHNVRDLLVALQDQVGYMESVNAANREQQLLAARENTLTLFNTVLQTQPSRFL